MRFRYIILGLSFAAAIHAPVTAQAPPESSQVFRQLLEDAALAKDALTLRRQALSRHTKLLTDLTDIGEGISAPAPSMALAHALKRLDDVQSETVVEEPLPEPVPSCLERLRLTLSRPGAELDPNRTRAEFFASLSQLEDRLAQLSEGAASEAAMYESVAQTLLMTAASNRSAALPAIRALIRTRKAALK